MVFIKPSFVVLALSAAASASNHFGGIAVSSFTSSGACKSAGDWNNVAATARANGFTKIRVYGNDGGCM
jgi:exo-beta-1,3-glucanase (GH17 family)